MLRRQTLEYWHYLQVMQAGLCFVLIHLEENLIPVLYINASASFKFCFRGLKGLCVS